jgi:hypothetical protein
MTERSLVELIVVADPAGGNGSTAAPATEGRSGNPKDRHSLGGAKVGLPQSMRAGAAVRQTGLAQFAIPSRPLDREKM